MPAATHRNNFDFLRLLFALFVVITHSYPLSGISECDVLCQYTYGQAQLSNIGLQGFFIISGYLVFQSLQRSKGIIDYYWKRIIRLFPALIVVLLFTVLVIVPLCYDDPVPYWRNTEVYSYVPRNLSLYFIQYGIRGVFTTVPYNTAINGSLWTLAYEFSLYIALSALFLIRSRNKVIIVLLSLVYILLFIVNSFYADVLTIRGSILRSDYLLNFSCHFFAGSLLAAVRYNTLVRYHNILLIISAMITIISLFAPFHFNVLHYISLPLLVVGVGIKCTPVICDISKRIGDLSYGVYIYAFVVQQTLMYFFSFNQLWLAVVSMPVSLLLAYGSWHLIEKRALRMKRISFYPPR
ncbi:MAG TPA: acyltransferase [Flavipsychrobacter sp.]